MSAFIERLRQLCKSEELTHEELAIKAGFKPSRITNLMNQRGQIKQEELEQLGTTFPEYAYWLAYGRELPEAGQISPMTKKAQQELKTQRKAE